jgi:hypothetical protein
LQVCMSYERIFSPYSRASEYHIHYPHICGKIAEYEKQSHFRKGDE